MKVTETKIDATAAKNALGSLGGVQDRPWGPSEGQGGLGRAQGTPCKALPMRSLEKRKKNVFLRFSRERIAIVLHLSALYFSGQWPELEAQNV